MTVFGRLRRLYSSCATMSSLFRDPQQVNADWCIIAGKGADYSSAEAILSSTKCNLGKLGIEVSSLGKSGRVWRGAG